MKPSAVSPLHAEPASPATAEDASRAGLEQAFALFNQMSTQLSESYSMLEARVTELARMLSGLADSETGLAHARDLMETARAR